MTATYCINKLNLLIRDYNHYKKMNDSAAMADYRTAIDNLIYVANRQGIKWRCTMTEDGYLAIK